MRFVTDVNVVILTRGLRDLRFCETFSSLIAVDVDVVVSLRIYLVGRVSQEWKKKFHNQ